MLHTFIRDNRDELIRRCRAKEARRFGVTMSPAELANGVPIFLDQLVDTLRRELHTTHRDTNGMQPAPSKSPIGQSASLHGAEMLRLGFSVDMVVHNYGDICQSVTDLAVERNVSIKSDEFRTLNRCLDDAIADAVTSHGQSRQSRLNEHAESLSERLDFLLQEQQRLIDIAMQAHAAVKTGNVGLTGSTGNLLIYALQELRALTERTVPEIRLISVKGTLNAP